MNFESLLQQRGIHYEKHDHPTTYTAQSLAHVEHVSGHMVAKPVIVKGETGFAMCVLPASKNLDLQRVADLLHEKRMRLATETEMAALFPDCSLGAEPPVGTLFGMRTIADEEIHRDKYLLMQAGSHNESIMMKREDWEKLCDPSIGSIAKN